MVIRIFTVLKNNYQNRVFNSFLQFFSLTYLGRHFIHGLLMSCLWWLQGGCESTLPWSEFRNPFICI